jgi:fermentation-respiration switch protein FrsA (DUF1100 family)
MADLNEPRGKDLSLETFEVHIPPHGLPGVLRVPRHAFCLVIFAHGSGSSRLSPRNIMVADAMNRKGIATLLFDLLKPEEENANNRAKVFEIPFLAERLIDAVRWAEDERSVRGLPIGLFGASTGAAAALVAAARLRIISAVVSRGGRPDLAGEDLLAVRAPTLLIVGGDDHGVIELNEQAYASLGGRKELVIVPGATHLFSERGALEQVISHAGHWFETHLHEAAHKLPR